MMRVAANEPEPEPIGQRASLRPFAHCIRASTFVIALSPGTGYQIRVRSAARRRCCLYGPGGAALILAWTRGLVGLRRLVGSRIQRQREYRFRRPWTPEIAAITLTTPESINMARDYVINEGPGAGGGNGSSGRHANRLIWAI